MIFGHSYLTRGNVMHSYVMAAVILLRGYISAQWLPKGGTMASISPGHLLKYASLGPTLDLLHQKSQEWRPPPVL